MGGVRGGGDRVRTPLQRYYWDLALLGSWSWTKIRFDLEGSTREVEERLEIHRTSRSG